MSIELVVISILFYLAALYGISYWANRNRQLNDIGFFKAGGQVPWYVVAFGMVGTSISGVTFISVPGDVGQSVAPGIFKQMGYMQVAFGYVIGYAVIATILLPLYYRLNLTSIYTYLESRLGRRSHQTGAFFFLLSRSLGSAARLYLATVVLQLLLFDAFNIPFLLTVGLMLLVIFVLTQRGMQTIIWTDTLQSTILITSVVLTLLYLSQAVSFNDALAGPYSQIWFTDWKLPNHFVKQLLSGALITIVMTGLDQGMMQKNLSCSSLKDAQKNVLSYSIVILGVNFLFVLLGAMLYLYADKMQIRLPAKSDYLFPTLAFHHFSVWVGIPVVLGLLSAAYSSADDCLTALTTSFCIDILRTDTLPTERAERLRKQVHLANAIMMFGLIAGFYAIEKAGMFPGLNVITLVLKLAGFTYGPLLGLYAFGLFTQRKVQDAVVPFICITAPLICLVLNAYSTDWWGYTFGFELIALNGLLTFVGLWLFPQKNHG